MGARLDKEKFLLQHDEPNLFHRSEWDKAGTPSVWYSVYRVVLALFMVIGIILHFLSTLHTLGAKWFIYMTNQGISLLTIHYILYAVIVVRHHYTGHVPMARLPFLYSLSWGLQSCFTTVALWITLVYWTVLHKYVIEFHILQGAWMHVLNVFLHLVNTLSCLMDMMVTARPVRIYHSYLPIIFGVWYTVFSAIYWAAGGTGACIHRCFDLPLNSTISKLDPSCPIHCDNYIYPILDWDAHPGMAVGIVLGGCVFMPVLQAFWYGVFKLRKYIAAKTL